MSKVLDGLATDEEVLDEERERGVVAGSDDLGADMGQSDGGDIGRLLPQDNRIVVMLDEVPGEVKHGKIIVIKEKERPQFGTVIDIGPKVESKDIVAGARICFGRYSGIEVELAGETYNIIRESDVLAVVENP